MQIEKHCLLKNGEEIPSLEKTLSLLSQYNSILFVELKDGISEKDFSLIKKYYLKRPEKIYIISFHKKTMAKVMAKKKEDSFFKSIRTIKLKVIPNIRNLENYDGVGAMFLSKRKTEKLLAKGKTVSVFAKNTK